MAEDPLYSESPHKKQKTSGLPKYTFVENAGLEQSDDVEYIDMDNMSAVRDTGILYTDRCASCSALIIVAKMDDGEIWHGLNHSSNVVNSAGIKAGFDILTEEIEDNGTIESKEYYLITSPQLKERRTRDADELDYAVTVYSPDVVCEQIMGGIPDSFSSYIDVKLSKGIIEVKYTP